MEDQAGEEDEYFADDLEALPDFTFHELPRKAIQSTHQPSLSPQVQLPTTKQGPGLTSGLGRLSVAESANHTANQPAFRALSSDYGDFDDDMLDGEIFDAAEEPALAVRYKTVTREHESDGSSQSEQQRLQLYRPDQRGSDSIETQHRVSQLGAFGLPSNDGSGPGGTQATAQEEGFMHLGGESRTRPPPEETTDVIALQAQVQKVGLLKAHFNGTFRLHFSLAAE